MRPHPIPLRELSIALVATALFGCNELPGVSGSATGAIQITASMSGAPIDRDPDGFTVSLDDGGAMRLPVTGLTLKDITPGNHTVKIGGTAPNCSVGGTNPRIIEVTASEEPLPILFDVTCQPNVGTLRISAVTTGEEIAPSGYGFVAPPDRRFTVPANGAVTIPDVRVAVLNLTLTDVAPNCDHLGSPVRPTQIVFGTTTEVVFTLHCVATGSFHITTTTSGVEADATGYVIEVSLPSKGTQSQIILPATGSTDIKGLPPGDYSIRLSDVANNCTVARSVFAAIALVAGTVTPVAFDVTCVATNQIAYTTKPVFDSRIRIVRSNAADNFEPASQSGSNLDPDWSPDGSRMTFSSDRDGRREIYTMDADGQNVVRLTNVAGTNYSPAWSPDGKKIAFVSARDGNPEIYVMDADGGNQVRTTANEGFDGAPSWSPDGRRIAFQSDRDGSQRIWIMNSDGSAPLPLANSVSGDRQPSWSPDGKKIAFSRTLSLALRDIYTLDIDGSNLTQISFNYPDASDAAWSPDGSQIAFSATRCTDSGYSWYYYDSICEVDILLARTDGRAPPSTPVLAAGYNPAWRR